MPISYDYSDGTRKQVMEYIKDRQYTSEEKIRLQFPDEPVTVHLPRAIADKIEDVVESLITGTELYGFRWQRHFQRMVMANALMRGSDIVQQEDYDRIVSLKKFINAQCKVKI